ncbi:hypothetical protein OAV15_01365 [Amylibacter sp.]|nr:hypothetical protein [Amylibacter sp.]
MKLREIHPILICVDIQLGFLDEDYWGGNRNNKNAEKICAEVLNNWRDIGEEVIHVRHSSKNPNSKLHKSSKGYNLIHCVNQFMMRLYLQNRLIVVLLAPI